MSTTEVVGVSDPVTYTAVLPAPDETVLFVSGLLAAERRRRGTRRGRRALGCYRQAVLILGWFLDGTRLAQLRRGRRTLPGLLGLLAPSAHPGLPSLACAKSGGIQPMGVNSFAARASHSGLSAPIGCS